MQLRWGRRLMPVLLTMAMSGCDCGGGGDGDAGGSDSRGGNDGGASDAALSDTFAADHAGADLTSRDHAVVNDSAGHDQSVADGASPDQAVADSTSTDQWVEDSSRPDAAGITPVSIEVTPADPFVAASHPQQLTATGTFSDSSTQDLTAVVEWTSSNPSVIAVSPTGLATWVKAGATVTLTATAPANGVSGSVVHAARKRVFVTAASGSAILGSWGSAGGQTGLAAGDAICQAAATSAHLHGIFKAWLSDDTDDAYCRIGGESGKRGSGCGVIGLPVAGPWVRMDGHPFANGLANLVGGKILVPLQFDENGTRLADYTVSFTGTNPSGDLSSNGSCSNWTSSDSATVNGGISDFGTYAWCFATTNCDATDHLICFETGLGAALPPFAAAGKQAFVTSATGAGDLSTWVDANGQTGLAAGDAICQARATAASLTGTFKAWLSTSSVDAIDRLTSTGPWVTLDGVVVATSKADLTDGSIFTAINRSDTGEWLTGNSVWTGTSAYSGGASGASCADWTSAQASDQGWVGAANSVSPAWSSSYQGNCNSLNPIFCFED